MVVEPAETGGDGCVIIPPADQITDGTENVTVVHKQFGMICFVDPFHKSWTPLAQSVRFGPGVVRIDLPRNECTRLGIPGRLAALVTLNELWPNGKRSAREVELRNYQEDLRQFCEAHGLDFVAYDLGTGAFRFAVGNLAVFPIGPP
jgi:hypothetical protein